MPENTSFPFNVCKKNMFFVNIDEESCNGNNFLGIFELFRWLLS